jgi:hypothetical protein
MGKNDEVGKMGNMGNMGNIDFVVPLCKNNMIFRATIESIVYNYHPRNIYIITNPKDSIYLESIIKNWDIGNTIITTINEDVFFMKNYGLTKHDIEQYYTFIDAESREFGWWYQQILKLGAYKQIENLSDPYVVWDSDVIVLQKWNLFDSNDGFYKFAILQECSKNEFNKSEYSKSIKNLIGLDSIEPPIKGTFVPHHFIMHHNVLDRLVCFIEERHLANTNANTNTKVDSWIKVIISLSKTYYRFSEYKCLATFMRQHFPELLLFYPFELYGKNGIRYRDSSNIVEKIKEFCVSERDNNLTYNKFKEFAKKNYDFEPSYIQIEHVDI